MTAWTLIQIFLNLMMALAIFVLWARLNRRPKDDPRLSRGLQLLQSKISVLEDLSDRTEVQVKQLTTLLEKKSAQLQTKILEAQAHVREVDQSIHKSKEVAEIFQDKIPHEEILERQKTIKYVRAAKMAYEGSDIEEIAREVDLSPGEIEFIAKVNKDQLMFDEQNLPEWLKDKGTTDSENWEISEDNNEAESIPMVFETPAADYESLKRVGDEFRKACEDFETEKRERENRVTVTDQVIERAGEVVENVRGRVVETAENIFTKATSGRVSVQVIPEDQGSDAIDMSANSIDKLNEKVNETKKTFQLGKRPSIDDVASGQVVQGATKQKEETHFVPDSYAKKELNVNRNEQRTIDSTKIKRVKFPSVDINDNLG